MSRTRRNKVTYSSPACWRFLLSYVILDEELVEKRHLLVTTTDKGSSSWRPWTQDVKHFNNRKSRTYARIELSKVYRDWSYHIETVKFHDNVWNWD